jgi:hypothetical protein
MASNSKLEKKRDRSSARSENIHGSQIGRAFGKEQMGFLSGLSQKRQAVGREQLKVPNTEKVDVDLRQQRSTVDESSWARLLLLACAGGWIWIIIAGYATCVTITMIPAEEEKCWAERVFSFLRVRLRLCSAERWMSSSLECQQPLLGGRVTPSVRVLLAQQPVSSVSQSVKVKSSEVKWIEVTVCLIVCLWVNGKEIQRHVMRCGLAGDYCKELDGVQGDTDGFSMA